MMHAENAAFTEHTDTNTFRQTLTIRIKSVPYCWTELLYRLLMVCGI